MARSYSRTSYPRQRKGSRRTGKRIALLLLLLLFTVFIDRHNTATYAQESTEVSSTPVPTETPTEVVTEAPTETPTEVATEAPTETPTEVVTEAPTETPTEVVTEAPTETPTEVVTEAPTQAPTQVPTQAPTQAPTATPTLVPPAGRGGKIPPTEVYGLPQTFCALDISDLGDNNPFTYQFSATNANNIASFAWDFGDTSTASTQTANHTYSASGTFNIVLTCTPNPGFGSPIVLTGQIQISSIPVANFSIAPSNYFSGNLPYTITATNESTGIGLSYIWVLRKGATVVDTQTTTNYSYTFTNNPANYGSYTLTLTAADGSASSSLAKTIVLNAPAPYAILTISSAAGTAPFSGTVEGIDQLQGPITLWEWDLNADGTYDAGVNTAGPHNFSFATTGFYFIRMRYTGPGGVGEASVGVNVFDSSAPVNAAFTARQTGAGLEVCFTNNSTGPVQVTEWDFNGDGNVATFNVMANNNSKVVCHTFAVAGQYIVEMRVGNGATYASSTETSTATLLVDVSLAPVASFTISPASVITQGTLLSFTDTSTGDPITWAWDFNGDGVTDSTQQNPSGVSISQLGDSPIRLTITNLAGLSSFVEQIVTVNRLEISCDFTGPLSILPTSGATAYNSVIGNQGGRPISYTWTVTGSAAGLPLTFSSANINVNFPALGEGAYVIRLDASTLDGSTCSTSKTVNVSFPALECNMTDNLPSPLYPTGSSYTFTADVANLAGRSVSQYRWYVDGALQQSGASSTFSWTAAAVGSYTIRYEVDVTSGGTTINCFEEKVVTVVNYPDPVCVVPGSISIFPDGNTYNFVATYSNVFGRTENPLTWTINGVAAGTTNPGQPLSWTNTDDSTASFPQTFVFRVNGSVTQGSDTFPCAEATFTVTVNAWPALTCNGINVPAGNGTPVPLTEAGASQTHNYSANVSGIQGRPATYAWTVPNGTVTTANPRDNNANVTIRWNPAAGELAPATQDDNIAVQVTVTNPDATTDSCTVDRNVAVTYQRLVCNTPTGDTTPVLNDTESYGLALVNRYGRSINTLTWTFINITGGLPGVVEFSGTGSGDPFNYVFTQEDQTYILRYEVLLNASASPAVPADSCFPGPTSGELTITTANAGAVFACESALTGSATINPSGTYNLTVDNGNDLLLNYLWTLSGAPGVTTILNEDTDTDGLISRVFTVAGLEALGIVPGTYTLEVTVSAPSEPSAPPCSRSMSVVVGSVTVDYSFTIAGGWTSSAMEIGSAICVTNISDANPGDINTMTYTWSGSATTSANSTWNSAWNTLQNPGGCFTFNAPGSYTLTLTGVTAGGMSGTRSVTFQVYGSQSILINRSSQLFAPATISFTATGTNITPGTYNWNFYDLANPSVSLGTRTGATPTFPFTAAGTYRAVVTGSGPLGITTASLDFTLGAPGGLRAAFTPTQYAGLSPLYVCFTDQSTSDPANTIARWEWDFEGDGTVDLIYTDPGTLNPGDLCHTYTAGPLGATFPARLTVFKPGLSNNALNTIRVYSVMESSATFRIQPQTASNFCFEGVVTGGIEITGWDFGDGNSAGAAQNVCHNYGASGTYIVRMFIRNPSTGETGEIIRTVTASSGSASNPALSVSGVCTAARVATFTVSNTGADMTVPESITIRDLNNNPILITSVQLLANTSTTLSVADQSGNVSLTSVDFNLSASTTCNFPPQISVSAACVNNRPVFTISNAQSANGPMPNPEAYVIRNSAGVDVVSDTFQLLVGVPSVTVSIPTGADPYDTYTFISSSSVGTFNVSHKCDRPATSAGPALSLNTVCGAPTRLTIANNGGAMSGSQPYQISDASGSVVSSGTLPALGAGGTFTINVSGVVGGSTLNFSTAGAAGTLNAPVACGQPSLSVSAMCGTGQFVITNSGANMTSAQNYTVTQADGVDLTPASNSVLLASGQSAIVALNGSFSQAVTLAINNSSAAATMNCAVMDFDNDDLVDSVNTTGVVNGTSEVVAVINGLGDLLADALGRGGFGLGANMSVRPGDGFAFSAVSAGCAVGNCPPFLVYHTNEADAWDLFRIDSFDEVKRENNRRNLTYGADMTERNTTPSVSPDGQWVVFSSNRDGNRELYIASSSGDPSTIERITFNVVAIDTDPVWGPGNYVVFETTRNGNWDLYMLDMKTGQEVQLTTDKADDINASWSPEGTKIAYQSNATGKWQVYVLDLLTMKSTRLTNGPSINVDPVYAREGKLLTYRSYTRDGANGMIVLTDEEARFTRVISHSQGDATNVTWSPDSTWLVYQSDLDGDLDIYLYQLSTGLTRKLTHNDVKDYAATWRCDNEKIVFVSERYGSPDLFEMPISGDEEAVQMTYEGSDDIYPLGATSDENASREGRSASATYSRQTSFLLSEASITPRDPSPDSAQRDEWIDRDMCAAFVRR